MISNHPARARSGAPEVPATFSALVIEKAENFYTLAFTAPGLPTATSAQFNIRFYAAAGVPNALSDPFPVR